MKNVKFLLSAACALFAVAAMAQQDFSDPKYAVWGDTPQEREQNILNSNFLKESLDNKDYNAAAHYLKELLDKCPKASQNTFVRGITLYKNKIARAKSIAEKNTYTDSLMIVYDLRNEYFGDHPKYGTPYILDRKAREYLMYIPDSAASKKVPVVFMFPGMTQNVNVGFDSTQWWQMADKDGAIIVIMGETYNNGAVTLTWKNSDMGYCAVKDIIANRIDGVDATID